MRIKLFFLAFFLVNPVFASFNDSLKNLKSIELNDHTFISSHDIESVRTTDYRLVPSTPSNREKIKLNQIEELELYNGQIVTKEDFFKVLRWGIGDGGTGGGG